MREFVRSFEAKDDKGNVYHLQVYQFVTERGTSSHPERTVSDLTEVVTTDGEPVSGVSKGVYRLVLRNIIVRSDDPKAP